MKNKYEIHGDVTVIYLLRKGVTHECLVDTNDLEKVLRGGSDTSDFTWCTKKNNKSDYLYAGKNDQRNQKIRRGTLMHRLIMDAPNGYHVDHINHNTLDNRKSNLRLVTNAENMQNKTKVRSSSGRFGVVWNKKSLKWQAGIKINGKNIYLGLFENIDDAANAVISAREEMMPFSQEATQKRTRGEIA